MSALKIFSAILLSLISSAPIAAMEMEYSPRVDGEGLMGSWPAHVFLSGPVEFGDDAKLEKILYQHKDIEEIVVGESPGGSLHAGIGIAAVIHRSGLRLQVNGPAASAATVISLGARTQLTFIEDAFAAEGTKLLFHCAYIRGQTQCDGKATQVLSDTLATFTSRSVDDWYNFLMQRTTPQTVEEVKFFDLLDEAWICDAETHRGTTCRRRGKAASDPVPLVFMSTSEVIIAARPSLQEAQEYVQEMPAGLDGQVRIFEANNGWFRVSLTAINSDICKGFVSRKVKDSYAWFSADSYCSSGEDMLRKFDWRTGKELPTIVEKEGFNLFKVISGPIRMHANPDKNSDLVGRIYHNEIFSVTLSGGEWWKVREQTKKTVGWIKADEQIVPDGR